MAFRPAPLAAVEEGPADGIPLVLLHAFPLDHTQWAPQLDGELGARVIAPDLRGFGASYYDEPTSIEGMAVDVLDLLDRMGVRRFILGGLSMGGYVAIHLAALAPERLLGLVLADTRAEGDTPEGKRARDVTAERIEREGMQVLVDDLMPKFFSPETLRDNPDLVRATATTMTAQSPETAVNALAAMRDRPDLAPLLRDIEAPTLVLVGGDDPLTTPESARKLAEGIPRARLEVIPRARHLSNLDAPEAFNDALAGFIAAVAREAGARVR